ncbi:MAG: tRNA (guanine-N1)-methyltransferase, partial [Candidatus Hecatellales archaeon]
MKLSEALKGKIPEKLLAKVPRSLDLIGHVAVVEIPRELEPYASLIGETLMRMHRHIETVLAKVGPVEGEHRIRRFKLIAGKPETETLHREHGCLFRLDVGKVYFSPRLSFEHARVAGLVRPGEAVLDMFAGVGPFSILIAKRNRNVRVYAVDANPEAYRYLYENVRLNKVEDRVTPVLGDIREVAETRLGSLRFDRVIMNLPEKASCYLAEACLLAKPEATVHYYCFAGGRTPKDEALKSLKENLADLKVEDYGVLKVRLVREVAPRIWQVAVD